STTALSDIQGVAGNEQLREILDQHDDLKKHLKQWAALAKLKQDRLPDWELVSALAQHGANLENLKEIHEELEQVRAKRLLLADQNPLSHLRTHVASALRQALKQAVDKYDGTYKEQLQRLEGSADWGELKPEQQKALLSRVGLRPPEKQSTGSDQDLLNALNNCGLDQWNTRTQALSQQASNALLEASRLLEPEVQSVHLSSGTLKDEKEVKAWLKDKEAELLAKVKKGPIVIQ
ncbi:MAG: BREX system P-loop protein BrxC, partial [Planctomycetes bacterium]|nr:BREX system P-loop protein BrxC [Planctomycetota bacterium]